MTKGEARRIVDERIHRHPEIRVIRRKQHIIEGKHVSAVGYHYCPECSTWSPEEPPEIKALDKEWKRVYDREVEKARKTNSVV